MQKSWKQNANPSPSRRKNIQKQILTSSKSNLGLNKILYEKFQYFQTLLHEMMFRIKTFFNRFSFVTQDKLKTLEIFIRTKQSVTTVMKFWNTDIQFQLLHSHNSFFNKNFNISEISSTFFCINAMSCVTTSNGSKRSSTNLS